MKSRFFFILFLLIVLPMVSGLVVEQKVQDNLHILDLDNPVEVTLEITNNDSTGTFGIYNLIGFQVSPESVYVEKGETEELVLTLIPRSDFNHVGFYALPVFFKKGDLDVGKEVVFESTTLDRSFEVGSGVVDPESNSMKVYIKNIKNYNFGQVHAVFDSPFFNFEEDFSLAPRERKEFDVTLDKEDFKKLMAGFYTLNVEVTVEGKSADVEGVIKFEEKNILSESRRDYGFVVSTRTITKTNEGNVVADTQTVVQKNIISRLFTTFSPEPDQVLREGFSTYYTWNRPVNPGESLEIMVKTNWLFPLIIILLIVAVIILVKRYSRTNVSIDKSVTFVRARGSEFALKVTLVVSAKKYVEKVKIIDRLPPLVKIYEKFPAMQTPAKVNEKARRIEWEFERLDEGETRVLKYIIYSKVGVMGKFALPSARAVYEREGQVQESESNKAFFVAEPRKEEEDEE